MQIDPWYCSIIVWWSDTDVVSMFMIDQSDQSASAVVTTIHWSNLSCAPVPTDQHIILSYTHQAAVTHNYDLLSTVDTSTNTVFHIKYSYQPRMKNLF